MNASTMHWVEICSIDEIPVRGAIRVEHEEQTIAVFRTAKNQIRALEDRCPHKGGPLSDGIVHGDCVTCPLHNWNISLTTGCAEGSDEGQTGKFNVRVDNGVVFLESSVGLSIA